MPTPKYVYHYTSQQGLLGILSEKRIRATDILYLNDSLESVHTFNIASTAIEVKLAEVVNAFSTESRFLHHIKGYTHNSVSPYVVSFSEVGDSLSQWRAYSYGANGYNIEFNLKLLMNLSAEVESKIFYAVEKCIYDYDEQNKMIRELIDRCLTRVSGISALEDFYQNEEFINACTDYSFTILMYSTYFKHTSFHEEKEWRLICYSHGKSNLQVKFRPGTSLIVPYCDIDLSVDNQFTATGVVVGPTPHPDLSKKSIERVVEACNGNITVSNSNIPYRHW